MKNRFFQRRIDKPRVDLNRQLLEWLDRLKAEQVAFLKLRRTPGTLDEARGALVAIREHLIQLAKDLDSIKAALQKHGLLSAQSKFYFMNAIAKLGTLREEIDQTAIDLQLNSKNETTVEVDHD